MSDGPAEQPDVPVAASRLFQIREDDLAELERIAPDLCQALFDKLGRGAPGATKLRKQLEKVRTILSDVRWNYGPPLDVERA